MSKSAPSSTLGPDQLSAMIADFQREKAAIADQRKEISVLIKQAVTEIDRLTQRNRDLSSQMRQLQANIEAFSRAEIQQLYSASQEAQMRLFMMQSQLEQLRNRQANLEKPEQLLNSFLAVADSLLRSAGESGSLEGAVEASVSTSARAAESEDSAGAWLRSIELAQHRLSRQLQDGSSQVLSDLILRAEVCERLVEMDRQKAKEEIARLRQAVTAALKSNRQLTYELQPPALEELGVAAALRRYVEVSRPGEGLQMDLQIDGQERRLPQRIDLAIFRIVQEALANAAQHSGSSRVEVRLHFEPGQVVATVADEGHGFEVGQILAEAALKNHSGLGDMQLRARLVGGTLEIDSKPGSGCSIRLAVPA